MEAPLKRRRLALLREMLRLVWRRKVFFLIPFFTFLIIALLLLVVLESPALLPFFYAIF